MKHIINIPSLTPLRGIAALLVIFFHFHLVVKPLLPSDYHIVTKFYLMVDLFFVLSGFILVHVYASTFEEKITFKNYFKFIKARFARIYPLHLFSFLILFGLACFLKSEGFFNELPLFLKNVMSDNSIPFVVTLTHSWGFVLETVWNIPSWSISVEWFLYLIFPLLLIIVPKKINNTSFVVIGVVCVALLFAIIYFFEPKWLQEVLATRGETIPDPRRPENSLDVTTTWIALLRGIVSFILGMITYYLYKDKRFFSSLSKSIYFFLFWLILLVGWFKDVLPDPIAVAIFPLIVLSAAYAKGILYDVLNGKVLTFLGTISYSIYLMHGVLLFFVFMFFNGESSGEINYFKNWLSLLVFIIVSIIFSTITYFVIEKPFRKLLKKL